MKRLFSGTILALLLASTLIAAFTVQPVKSDFAWTGTIYILADGSIQPSTVPISSVDNVTYTLTDNIAGNLPYGSSAIIIQRGNIIIDGADHTLNGTGAAQSTGMKLTGTSNVTIKNMKITAFNIGVWLDSSNHNSVSGNNITNNAYGVWISNSSTNSINGNNITNNWEGLYSEDIYIDSSSSNSVSGNTFVNGDLDLYSSNYSSVSGNTFVNGGLRVEGSFGNVVSGNLVNGKPLVYLEGASDYAVGDAGQVVLVKCNNVTVENLNLSNTDLGVELLDTKNAKISGNNITKNEGDVVLDSSSNCSVSGNNITGSGWNGIEIDSSSNCSVSGNNIAGNNLAGLGLAGLSFSISVSGNNITGNNWGVDLVCSSNISVSGNNITKNDYGVSLLGAGSFPSSNNIVSGNNITGSSEYGVSLDSSSNHNNVSGNNIDNGGIWLLDSSNNDVNENNMSNSGILLSSSSSNRIGGNNIASHTYGVSLDSSSSNNITGNNITEKYEYGIPQYGVFLNTSSNNSVSGNNITGSSGDGIWVGNSISNSISRNNITRNNGNGIWVGNSSSNSISGNDIVHNQDGIWLNSSSNNSVTGNNITENYEYGMWLYYSSGNRILHNNFVNYDFVNYTFQVHSGGPANVWDNGSTGNYWSDYLTMYPNASEVDSSGVWNTPYVIDADNVDHYPLVNPVTVTGMLTQSSTSVTCSPNPANVGSPVTCTATVYGSNPTGTVTWSTSSSAGSFNQQVSTLSSGTCSTTYTDTSAGSVIITASYSGDPNNDPSSGSTTLTVSTLSFFSFTVSTSGNLFTVNKGGSATVPVTVNLTSGVAKSVSLSVAWIPTGSNQWFTTSFSTTSGDPPFTSTLSVTTSNAIPDGMYTAQILASEGGNVESATVTVAVNPHYNVTFTQVGLDTGTQWSVTFNGQIQHSYSDSITFFDVANGVYSFSATTSFPGYAALPASSDLGVNLGNTTTDVIFAPSSNSHKLTSWDPARDSYNTKNFGSVFAWQTLFGNCFGIASTAELYFRNNTLGDASYPCFPSQSPQATSTSDLDLGVNAVSSLNDASLAVMFHQAYDPENSILSSLIQKSTPADLPTEFSQLKASLDAGIPAVLIMWSSSSGHAVVAWGYTALDNGSYAISIYDSNYPESTQVAIYNPSLTGDFYYGETGPYQLFAAVGPAVISTSWFSLDFLLSSSARDNYLNCSVTGYYIVVADKMVSVTSGGLKDYFTASGDSRTFVCGIPGSSGIEEGSMQVYAIPEGTSFSVADPAQNESTILITRVDNESGQIVGYGYLLNATATQGLLNYTVTPTGSRLSIIAGDSSLNASVTFFSATGQNFSVSQVSDMTVNAMQMTNFTVANWETLNDTGIQTTTAPVPEFPSANIFAVFMALTMLVVALTRKNRSKRFD